MDTRSTPPGLPFMKMHGLGNDFVVIDSRGREAVATAALARALGDRNRGVGFDQLAELRDATGADVALDFWNADGTRAGACGNATRCVAEYVLRASARREITIQTARGVLSAVRRADGQVSVNMGHPQFDWREIPLSREVDTLHLPMTGDPVAVGMGNPHCVFFLQDAEIVDVATLGAKLEHDALFPLGTNVEFASLRSSGRIRMRVWERGTGITLACGSGACATAVAASRRGMADRTVVVELDGGNLEIEWRDDGVWMTGPTAHVFDGILTSEFLAALE